MAILFFKETSNLREVSTFSQQLRKYSSPLSTSILNDKKYKQKN